LSSRFFRGLNNNNLKGVSKVNYHKIIIIGIATENANVRKSKKGVRRHTTFTLDVIDRYGESTYLPIVVFGKLSEIAAKNVTKGSQVLVEGRMQFRDIGRMSVIADRLQFGTYPSPIQPVRKTE